jgi:hypothetical protein
MCILLYLEMKNASRHFHSTGPRRIGMGLLMIASWPILSAVWTLVSHILVMQLPLHPDSVGLGLGLFVYIVGAIGVMRGLLEFRRDSSVTTAWRNLRCPNPQCRSILRDLTIPRCYKCNWPLPMTDGFQAVALQENDVVPRNAVMMNQPQVDDSITAVSLKTMPQGFISRSIRIVVFVSGLLCILAISAYFWHLPSTKPVSPQSQKVIPTPSSADSLLRGLGYTGGTSGAVPTSRNSKPGSSGGLP